MIAENLISEVVPPLKWGDTGQKALNWMEVFRISHLPIVEKHQYFGMVSDRMIYDLNLMDKQFGEVHDRLLQYYVFETQHIYKVYSIVSEYNLSVIPVLNQYEEYKGVITILDLTREFAGLVAVDQPGGVIELELNETGYSLAQITQIVEGNDAHILSMYMKSIADSKQIIITLKINVIDLSRIIQTFVRYDYNVKAVYSEDSMLKDVYAERFGQLMNFLNM